MFLNSYTVGNYSSSQNILSPKKALDDLENDTKANFQENIPVKVQFQGAMAPPGSLFV